MDPFTIALALGLMLGGSYFKKRGMEKISAEQGRVSARERERQGRLEDQKQAAITGALPQLSRPAQEQEQQSIAQRLADYYQPGAITAGDFVEHQNPGAPQEIVDRKAAAIADTNAKGSEYAKRLADVSSYGLLNFGNSQLLNRTGENVGQLVTAQQNSSGILPVELQAAERAGAKDFLYADILNGAGSIAGMYGGRFGGTTPKAPILDAGTPARTNVAATPRITFMS